MVEIANVSKRYGDVQAVQDFNLTTRDGEFVVLVGPSGCGKTNTHANDCRARISDRGLDSHWR